MIALRIFGNDSLWKEIWARNMNRNINGEWQKIEKENPRKNK